ncbi:death domain-containing protein 1 [Pseudophryne corroboree]|uniref:death domain-containing protein 1 n=1 Tax=Pseudophryne corroboree TaxID=495146 RepID=UPI0030820DB8
MDISSSNVTSAEDPLILILAQIKQYNENIKDVLEDSHPKNNEDLTEQIFSLTLLIHNLSRTVCANLSTATESLQKTFHLLKGLQDTFKELSASNEHINYLIAVKQILGNTARDLKLAEEQLDNITAHYKNTVDEENKKNVAGSVANGDTEGFINNREITDITESPEPRRIADQEKELTRNTQSEETDNLTISDTNDLSHKSDNEDEAQETIEKRKENSKSVYAEETKQRDKQELNTTSYHKEEYKDSECDKSDKQNFMELSSTDVTVNGTTVNLLVESLMENRTYKEYTLQEKGDSDDRLACFIKAPPSVLQKLQCRFRDDISSLVVSDSEELVSSVLRVSSVDTDLKIPFPINISIPFSSHYRGSYKDIMIKAIEKKFQASYLTPHSLDGHHGQHKGSFAEVKVYKLGTFCVVSCLKKENFTILKKGLSLKLNVDSRISLNYPPGCFSSSVIVQFKVQPIDTSLISALKVKHDVYHPVVSTSPLIHVKQPAVHVLHKPVTVFLPCPPNPEKKKSVNDTENKRASSAAASNSAVTHQIRAVSASVRKHGTNPSELLKLLALKEDHWIILDDIVVKNTQTGIVSFEINEHIQSFIIVRLSSTMDNVYLISFIQSLENALRSSMVNVVLHRKKENLEKVIIKLVPSKELNWEISALVESGYTEPSEPIVLQEGDQIHCHFYGNIAASDGKLTFHSQRMQNLSLDLRVVDEFGNYSSPHYKGTVAFYKLSKEDITESYKTGLAIDLQQRTPVCKLPLSLPKVEKNISRPSSTKLITCEPTDLLWDSVLKWVSHELSEEDAAEMLLSLPIRRSTIQLVRLKSPNNLSAQIYELLSLWKKRLPTSTDKFHLLARHLLKSGRSDLVEQMKIKWESHMSGSAKV